MIKYCDQLFIVLALLTITLVQWWRSQKRNGDGDHERDKEVLKRRRFIAVSITVTVSILCMFCQIQPRPWLRGKMHSGLSNYILVDLCSEVFCHFDTLKTVEFLLDQDLGPGPHPKYCTQLTPAESFSQTEFRAFGWCVQSGFRSHTRLKHCLLDHPIWRLGHTGRQRIYSLSYWCRSRGFRRVNSHFGLLGLGVAPRFLQKVRASHEILSNKLGLLPRRDGGGRAYFL